MSDLLTIVRFSISLSLSHRICIIGPSDLHCYYHVWIFQHSLTISNFQQRVGLKKSLNEYTCSDIPQLCEGITEKYSDLLGPLPLKLPPIREVSHEIPLINESKQLKHRLPKCPEAFCSELARKIERYTTAGWWVPAAAKQATLMLCIPKRNGTLRTVFDL